MDNRGSQLLTGIVRFFRNRLKGLGRGLRAEPRRLRLRETLPMGEKRFLAIVEFHEKQLLVGGTANSIALLGMVSRPGAAMVQEDLELCSGPAEFDRTEIGKPEIGKPECREKAVQF